MSQPARDARTALTRFGLGVAPGEIRSIAGDPRGVQDRRCAVLDGHRAAVLSHQRGMVGQGHGAAFAQDSGDGFLQRMSGLLVDDAKHAR